MPDGTGELVALLDKMALFLESPVTRGILFKPIARKIAVAAADCRAMVTLLLDPPTVSEFSHTLAAIEGGLAGADLAAPPRFASHTRRLASILLRRGATFLAY